MKCCCLPFVRKMDREASTLNQQGSTDESCHFSILATITLPPKLEHDLIKIESTTFLTHSLTLSHYSPHFTLHFQEKPSPLRFSLRNHRIIILNDGRPSAKEICIRWPEEVLSCPTSYRGRQVSCQSASYIPQSGEYPAYQLFHSS